MTAEPARTLATPIDAPPQPGVEPSVSWATIGLYSAPTLGVGFMFLLVNLYIMPFGTETLGLSAATIGTIIGVSRIWDAISDPLTGFLSDRTHTRLGRRRPWLLASIVPIMASFLMLWTPPPGLSQTALTAWMAVGVLGFYSAMTLFVVPHQSLGAEFTASYHDRSRVFGMRHVGWTLGSLVALPAMYLLIQSTDARSTAFRLAAAAAVVTALLIALAIVALRERPDFIGRGGRSPWKSFADVLRNPHARVLLIVFLIENIGGATIGILTYYVATYIVETPSLTPVYIALYMVASIVSVPLWLPLARRFGKKALWIFSMWLTGFAFGAMWFLESGSWLLISALAVLGGLAGGCGASVGPSVQSDVIDYDEFVTHERKEGSYFATWNFVFKAASGITIFLTGWVLEVSGFSPHQEQTETAKTAILALYSLFPMTCYAIGALFFMRFRLGEGEHRKIRTALDQRARATSPTAQTADP